MLYKIKEVNAPYSKFGKFLAKLGLIEPETEMTIISHLGKMGVILGRWVPAFIEPDLHRGWYYPAVL
jgi:hypothetical protein